MTTLTQSPILNDINSEWISDFFQEQKNPDWLMALRLKAFAAYEALPWPGKNDERWKRTELNLLAWKQLTFSATGQSDLWEKTEAPEEVSIIPLEKALEQQPELIKSLWEKAIQSAAGNKFLLFTLAVGNGGSCLIIPKQSSLKTPIHRTLSGGKKGHAYFPLHFIVAEENSHAQLWEEMGDETNNAAFFISNYSNISIKNDAQLNFYFTQHWSEQVLQFQFQHIHQLASSQFNSVAIAMGGRVFHNESVIDLAGMGAQNKVLGVLFGDKKQNFENWITQNHRARKTISDIQYRGALKGTSKSFFSGLVSIVKEAQQSDAYQSAKSLLLSNEARADAIPNLEILADDVKCAHGAAVGPVDEDQKFYLRSRGIPTDLAEQMIVEGFFEPVINEIPSESAQERIRTFINKKLSA